MPYETDQKVLAWFEQALKHDDANVRCRAIELLLAVQCARRSDWLVAASTDLDQRVCRTAAMITEMIEHMDDLGEMELFESDFMDERVQSDLEWRWQYEVVVVQGNRIPIVPIHVWLVSEDDGLARSIAALKVVGHGWNERDVVSVIVAKTGVTRYTRSARGESESIGWMLRGRPSYEDDLAKGEHEDAD